MNRAQLSVRERAGSSRASGVAAAFLILMGVIVAGCGHPKEQVVVYTSQDQVYAEPIFEEFTKETGIKVLAIYDSEAAKTVGLVNRLIAEQNHPQCDVFWNSEELRTRQLAAKNMFRESNGWAAFGYRSRRLAVNTNNVSPNATPRTWRDLTNAPEASRVVLAYPLFGTTGTHFLALRQLWGKEGWRNWCRTLAARKPMLVDGNSVAAQMVSKGEAIIAMTDSDDIAAENREGGHLLALPTTNETLLIPNTVGVLRDCPDPEPAEKLFRFLQRRETVDRLIAANALEGFSPSDVTTPTLKPDWDTLLGEMDATTAELKEIFLR